MSHDGLHFFPQLSIADGRMPCGAFYRERIPPNEGRPVFEDLLLTFGGGIEVFLTSHLALRPEVTMDVITTRDDRLTKAVYGVHVAYHFEARARP